MRRTTSKASSWWYIFLVLIHNDNFACEIFNVLFVRVFFLLTVAAVSGETIKTCYSPIQLGSFWGFRLDRRKQSQFISLSVSEDNSGGWTFPTEDKSQKKSTILKTLHLKIATKPNDSIPRWLFESIRVLIAVADFSSTVSAEASVNRPQWWNPCLCNRLATVEMPHWSMHPRVFDHSHQWLLVPHSLPVLRSVSPSLHLADKVVSLWAFSFLRFELDRYVEIQQSSFSQV